MTTLNFQNADGWSVSRVETGNNAAMFLEGSQKILSIPIPVANSTLAFQISRTIFPLDFMPQLIEMTITGAKSITISYVKQGGRHELYEVNMSMVVRNGRDII